MAKKAEEYGLPPLMLSVMADLLQIDKATLWSWIVDEVRPGPSRWSEWLNETKPLPERLLRLYLTRTTERARSSPPSGSPGDAPSPRRRVAR